MKALLIITAALALPSVGFSDVGANWTKHCARCHAEDGTGSTKIGQKLGLKDYTKADGQKFTDEEGVKAVLEGIKNEDTGKNKMPSYSEKLTEAEAKELIAHVRSFKK